jgi:hypothetical protein
MNATRDDQRGSVLIIAIIAMMIMGILSISFALLARVEVAIGVNYKAQAQAEALAEAGLERGRDQVRTASSETCGFTRWTDANSASYTPSCGSALGSTLFSAEGLGAGSYSVALENDCFPRVPLAIQDPQCGASPPLTGGADRDSNETAVLTAWATTTSNGGRTRVQAILSIDNPWKHVCSNSSQDNPPGYCNEPANRNGSPNITPSDPNDPNGPAAYDTLPNPTLGCSEIDPTLHGNVVGCSGSRKVVTGDASKANCNGGGQTYQGYFDCALTTPGAAYGGGPACVKFNDTRHNGTTYIRVPAPGSPCPAGATGMVFNAVGATTQQDWSFGDIGTSATNGVSVYAMQGTGNTGKVTIQSATFYGTLVVEGDGSTTCTGPNRDMALKNNGTMWTANNVYGYPLTLLIYDPQQPVPTAASPYAPQNTCADMGSSNTLVNGIVYSGGAIEFNPISVNGGVLGYELQTQGGNNAVYNYNPTYGNAAPPPGFPTGSGNQVVIVRKSFVVCGNYAAGSGTACE